MEVEATERADLTKDRMGLGVVPCWRAGTLMIATAGLARVPP